jgi:hypothetical protein
VRPVIEQRYELGRIGEAMQRMTDGHLRAKLVVTVSDTVARTAPAR